MIITNESLETLNYKIGSSGTDHLVGEGQIPNNTKIETKLPEGSYWVSLANVGAQPNVALYFSNKLTNSATVAVVVNLS